MAPFFVGGATAPRFALPATYPHDATSPMRLHGARQLGHVAVLTYRLTGRARPPGLPATGSPAGGQWTTGDNSGG